MPDIGTYSAIMDGKSLYFIAAGEDDSRFFSEHLCNSPCMLVSNSLFISGDVIDQLIEREIAMLNNLREAIPRANKISLRTGYSLYKTTGYEDIPDEFFVLMPGERIEDRFRNNPYVKMVQPVSFWTAEAVDTVKKLVYDREIERGPLRINRPRERAYPVIK